MNFSDPFGLCPDGTGKDGKQTTNVKDCPKTAQGNAWRALAGAGKSGSEVIKGVVAGGINVVTGNSQNTCQSQNSCFDPSTNTITLDAHNTAGANAVSLSHEYTHSTEVQATTATQWGKNELAAWDASRGVYNKLQGAYRTEAVAEFSVRFNALAVGTPDRMLNLNRWIQNARRRWGIP